MANYLWLVLEHPLYANPRFIESKKLLYDGDDVADVTADPGQAEWRRLIERF